MSGPLKTKRGPALVGDSIQASGAKTRATLEGGHRKGPFYKPLPKEFRRGGFTYKQIVRQRDAAIYKQTWNSCRDPSVCYEVIRIRRREGFQIGEKLIQPYEIYPNSDAWGVDGFTLTNKAAAFAKLRELA